MKASVALYVLVLRPSGSHECFDVQTCDVEHGVSAFRAELLALVLAVDSFWLVIFRTGPAS